MPRQGLRDTYTTTLVPPWLADDAPETPGNPPGIGGRYMYVLGLALDVLLDKMEQGILARMPGLGTPTALPYLGADRQIVRGLGEGNTSYALRLTQAFDSWQRAGNAATVLQQAIAFVGKACKGMVIRAGDTPRSYTFLDSADVDLPPEHQTLTSWAWGVGYGVGGAPGETNGDDPHPLTMKRAWWRSWLVLFSVGSTAWTQADGTWGSGGIWDDGGAWDTLSTPYSVFTSLRAIVGQWKCANTWYRWLVVSFDADFANGSAGAAWYPASTWNDGYALGTATNADGNVVACFVNTRDDRLMYCDGIASTGSSPFPYY